MRLFLLGVALGLCTCNDGENFSKRDVFSFENVGSIFDESSGPEKLEITSF